VHRTLRHTLIEESIAGACLASEADPSASVDDAPIERRPGIYSPSAVNRSDAPEHRAPIGLPAGRLLFAEHGRSSEPRASAGKSPDAALETDRRRVSPQPTH